jgi:formylglycine-generating enzyme required for sulfatase activity
MAPRLKLVWLVVALSAVAANLPRLESGAFAAGLDPSGEATAKEASGLYRQGLYEDAAKLFARLVVDYPDMLIFERSLGACFYYLRKPEPALSNLRNYLVHRKDIPTDDKVVVDRWIDEMEKLRAQNAAVPVVPPIASPAAPASHLAPARPRPAPQPASGCAANQVSIPGGTFWMGDADLDKDSKPVHKVTLSPYCIDKTEVTVAAFRTCVQAGECAPPSATIEWKDLKPEDKTKWSQFCTWGRGAMDQHPINCVDWNQATAYCVWTGGRLPTEAEWEFAARGRDGRKYPWGDEEPDATRLNACGPECASMAKERLALKWNPMYPGNDGWAATAPVGKYPKGASPFGVLDMAGNVWEWTGDEFANYSEVNDSNPHRYERADSLRVDRGGGWNGNHPSWFRAANRGRTVPGNRSINLGFRCARGAQM